MKNKAKSPNTASKYVVDLAMLAQLTVEAKLRVTLAGQVKLFSNRYETVFTGLKKNHPHAVALVQPIGFLIRRIIFAVIIIFLYPYPLFATLSLLTFQLLILGFLLTEYPWETTLLNSQHIVNEIALYLIVFILYILTGSATINTTIFNTLGWTIIGLFVALLAWNFLVILITSLGFFKFFILKMRKKWVVRRIRKK